jgi:hypothetical protein
MAIIARTHIPRTQHRRVEQQVITHNSRNITALVAQANRDAEFGTGSQRVVAHSGGDYATVFIASRRGLKRQTNPSVGAESISDTKKSTNISMGIKCSKRNSACQNDFFHETCPVSSRFMC